MDAHFAAIGATIFAISLIVAANQWGFNRAIGKIYGGLLDRSNASGATTAAALEPGAEFAREGARWALNARAEVNLWSVILMIAGVVLVVYHFYSL